jgi:hypothetical protein
MDKVTECYWCSDDGTPRPEHHPAARSSTSRAQTVHTGLSQSLKMAPDLR